MTITVSKTFTLYQKSTEVLHHHRVATVSSARVISCLKLSLPCQAALTITVLLYNELWADQLTTDTQQMQEFTHGGPRAGTASPMTLHDFTSST